MLEEQRVLAMLAEDGGRELLDRAIALDHFRGGLAAKARDAWVAVRRVADEGEKVRNVGGTDAEFFADSVGAANVTALAIDLHDAIADHALCEVFVRRPDADFLDGFVARGEVGRRGECVVCLHFDHRPGHHAHCGQSQLERMKLRP